MQIEAIPYRDQFRFTNYPFVDSARLETKEGSVLPQELFLDASVYVDNDLVNLLSVVRSADQVTFYLGNTYDSRKYHFSLNLNSAASGEDITHIYSKSNELRGIMVYDASAMMTLLLLPEGEQTFVGSGIAYCLSCYVPIKMAGLTSIQITNKYNYSYSYSGAICLVGADGIILEQKENVITVHVAGDPLYERVIDKESYETPRFLKILKLQTTNKDKITIDQELEITPDDNGIIGFDTLDVDVTGVTTDAFRVTSNQNELIFSVVGAS